jgi:hypothetical protein
MVFHRARAMSCWIASRERIAAMIFKARVIAASDS